MIDVILSYYLICKKRVEEYGFVDCLIVYYGSVVNFFFLESFFIYVFLVEGGFYFRMWFDFLKEVFWVFELNGWLL